MRYESTRKPRTCPHCGSRRIARIGYGMPAYTKKLERALEAGRIVLGGCCVTEDDPRWQCIDCSTRIYPRRVPSPETPFSRPKD